MPWQRCMNIYGCVWGWALTPRLSLIPPPHWAAAGPRHMPTQVLERIGDSNNAVGTIKTNSSATHITSVGDMTSAFAGPLRCTPRLYEGIEALVAA